MNALTDQQLLREYAERHSEAAFTEVVRRHVDLVYSVARRMTGEAAAAEDVTQSVFVALAQNAARLADHPVLSGWLHTTARNLAAKSVRAAVRRQLCEQEAVAMNQLVSGENKWERVAPHLDACLGELEEGERDALLLRYFEKKSASEIAAVLGISDAAAQKRVSRALERLRELVVKRGVTVGSAGLAAVLTTNAVQAAPVALLATVSAAALGSVAVSTTTVIAATAKTVAMTTLQKTIITLTAIGLAGAGTFEAVSRLREQNATNQRHARRAEGKTEVSVNSTVSPQFQENQIATVNAAKHISIAMRVFAARNKNQYPTNLAQISDQLGGLVGVTDGYDFEIVSTGLGGDANSRAVMARERVARQAPDGTWRRVYTLADGSVWTAESQDGNFDAWEKANTAK